MRDLRFYGPDGRECSPEQFASIPLVQRTVGLQACPDGTWVSTFLVGQDQRPMPAGRRTGPPLIFQSLTLYPVEREVYATWAEALAGHQRLVARARLLDAEIPW